MTEAPTLMANLVGTNFRPEPARERCKSLGDVEGIVELDLERDPENPYDENAIKVICPMFGDELDDMDASFIGFIERGVAAQIAPLMDAGQKYVAYIEAPVLHSRGTYWLLRLEPYNE